MAMLFGVNGLSDLDHVNMEIVKFLTSENDDSLELVSTKASVKDNKFKHSCDIIEKMFDENFYSEL